MSARAVRRLLPVLMVMIGACTMGEWDDAYRRSPRGFQAEFEIGGEEYRGELLTADTTGVLVLTGTTPVRAAWTDIEEFRIPQVGAVRIDDREPPVAEQLERIRLAARYPWGLSEAQLRDVRERSGWEEIQEPRR